MSTSHHKPRDLIFSGSSMSSFILRILLITFIILDEEGIIADPQHDLTDPSGVSLLSGANESNETSNLENHHLDLDPSSAVAPSMPSLVDNSVVIDSNHDNPHHDSMKDVTSGYEETTKNDYPVASPLTEANPVQQDLVDHEHYHQESTSEKTVDDAGKTHRFGNPIWTTPLAYAPRPTSPPEVEYQKHGYENIQPIRKKNTEVLEDRGLSHDIPFSKILNQDHHTNQVDTQKSLQHDIIGTINGIKSQLHDSSASGTNYGSLGNENIVRHLKEKPETNCSANEIYIIDGERTLLLTNRKLTTDIETMEDKSINIQGIVQNQNEIIFQLKQRLKNSESQVEDTLGLLIKHERSYQKLLKDLNETKSRENDMAIRNEILQEEVAKERKGRVHYQQISDHFKQEMDKANERLNAIADGTNEKCDKTIYNLRSKYEECKREINEKTRAIHGLYHEQELIKDNLGVFNRTRVKYSKHKCRLMEEQLEAQDDALFLLKDQVKAQAHTLESMNRLISMKHDTIENIHKSVE